MSASESVSCCNVDSRTACWPRDVGEGVTHLSCTITDVIGASNTELSVGVISPASHIAITKEDAGVSSP